MEKKGLALAVDDGSVTYLPWETYDVQGYVKKGKDIYLMISGQAFKYVEGERFRNYDPISKTVEYFGHPIRKPQTRSIESRTDRIDIQAGEHTASKVKRLARPGRNILKSRSRTILARYRFQFFAEKFPPLGFDWLPG